MFEQLGVEHKTDTIRLALLEKHGGVWADATLLMLRPLDGFLGSDPSVRTFYSLGYVKAQRQFIWERRVDFTQCVENWFLAAPPGDVLVARTRECVARVYEAKADRVPLDWSGMFSRRQLSELHALGIDAYLSTHACIFKTLDEDAELWRWWRSSNVRHIKANDTAFLFESFAKDTFLRLQ